MDSQYQIYVEVLDASGNKVASGPLMSAMSASITRELDGVGSVSLAFPAEDYAVVSALTNERRVEIYVWDSNDAAGKRLLGSGIMRKIGFSQDAGSAVLVANGPDSLDELKRVNTWLAWVKDNTAVATIFGNLVSLASGWTSDTSGITGVSALSIRLDGVSALAGLQALCKQKGIHFRLGDGKEVEGGLFGADSGVRLVAAEDRVSVELYDNNTMGVFERLYWNYDSEQVVNTIVPLGPGDFEAALTLKHSTRTTPYTIQSMVKNGVTLYYLADSTSVTAFGTIEKMMRATGVSALSNSEADLENAANALYDVAATFLQRYSVKQEAYSVTIRNITQNLKPGQKVRLTYQGFAYDIDGNPVKWVSLDDSYWILQVRERFDLSGRVIDLQLSNVDIPLTDGARMVIGELDEIKMQNIVVKPYLSKDTISFPAESIDSSNDVVLPFAFGAYTARVNQVILRLWTRPFRTNVTGAESGGAVETSSAAGGDHNHKMFSQTTVSGFPGTSLEPLLAKNGSGGATVYVKFEKNNSTDDIWTDGGSGDHTHDISISSHTHAPIYGIYDDTDTPVDVEIYVDGSGTAVGSGPYATLGEELALEIDITDEFSETTFQGQHTITVTCASGQGLVIAQIEVRETIQSIAVV